MTQRIALVTGAGSGIGQACAVALGRAGFTVVLAGRRRDRLDAIAAELGNDSVAVTADVTDEASVDALFEGIRSRFGRLDVLFNNAGTGAPARPLEDTRLEEWRAVVETNVTGVFLCTRAAFRLMKAQTPRGGRIINNGSISAMTPRPNIAAYTASKHAVTGLTKQAALEGRRHDIACGQIDIGNTATDMASQMSKGVLQADDSLKPEPTFDVRHVAEAVVYMARLPLDANVLSMTVMATRMPFVGRG
ncbi:MAG TPA: SDR family oxidoreductase [Steroidobacteraceae bacterium]|nr:SDR family oxidoreductase [Steroidobacteraceae bacterium]